MSAALLANSLAHVDALLASCANTHIALALSDDRYRIDLPTLGGDSDEFVTVDAMRTLASLYFMAEAEGVFMIAVAEELALARFELNVTDRSAAEQLEELATSMRGDWVSRDLRNQIFSRVFGLGFMDTNLGDTLVNREFEPRFAMFCAALRRVGEERLFGSPGLGSIAVAGTAGRVLIRNLGGRLQGPILTVAGKISRQLRDAIAILGHPGIRSVFLARTAWDVIRAVLGDATPDLFSRVERAQNGMRLLSWVAEHLGELQANVPDRHTFDDPSPVVWAENWLRASQVTS